MPMYRRLGAHRNGEKGAALPLALAFLVLFAVLTGLLLTYVSTGLIISSRNAVERGDVYAVGGTVDAAVKWVQSDASLARGAATDPTCPTSGTQPTFFSSTGVNSDPVTVTCQASSTSGGSLASTTSPPFAILTTAPYHGPAPTSGCVNVNDELGIVQVQNSKRLTVNGNVYVNSDVDADVWSGGCPQTSTAEHIKVVGNVLQRESNHDVDVLQPSPAVTPAYTYTAPIPSPTAGQAALLADPAIANPASWAPNITTPPAAGTIQDASGANITTCPAADPATGYRLVKFGPGTFSDATVMNAFMGGACPNALFWFQPGNYYFNFTNAGTHEWAINDTTTRVVAGQPTSVSVGAQTFSGTWKPATTTSSSFTTPNNAQLIDGTTTNATVANGQTASITLTGFTTSPTTAIPADAQINSVRLRVAHGEDSTSLLQSPTVTITPSSSAACTPVALTKHTSVLEDAAPNYDVTSCLNTPSKINDATSMVYSVAHCTGASPCATTSSTARLDGIWLDITYTTSNRPAWDPTDSTTITASSPTVPGGCRRDGDVGWTNGVQFVFGGDSRINLLSGKLELCDQPSSTKQEIVLYGAKGTFGSPVGPTAWTAQQVTNGSTGFTNPANGRLVDGAVATAALSSTTTTRTVTLSNFSPTAAFPVPAANQIPTGSTINAATLQVTHSGSSGANVPTVTVTPAGSSACAATNVGSSAHTALSADSVDLTACLNTPAKINTGVSVLFTARRASGSPTESLDGMQLQVTYTPPASSGLNGEGGCIAQTPYYSPVDHSPAYNGACALLRVTGTQAPPLPSGSFPRIVALWGTVYAPLAALDVPVDVMTVPVFNRGVVARMLMLGYNVANNAVVPITTTPLVGSLQNRRMTLVASVPGKTTKVTADVEICDYGCSNVAAGGVKVWSWTVTR